MEILLLGKDRDDFYFKKATEFLSGNLDQYSIRLASQNETYPESLNDWKGDYIISYLCPWVLPKNLLDRAAIAAINFHPGPPEYPGTGCTNFAIYNEENVFGVTCHTMAPGVDSGKIIAVKRFPILNTDSVFSLTQRCYAYMLVLFYEIMSMVLTGEKLPESNETWTRQPYQRKELNCLKKVDMDMPEEEIKRRIKASAYPGTPGAYVILAGEKFEFRPD